MYPERTAELFCGRLYINSREREDDIFLRELATRPVQFQEVRIAESPFRQPLCDLIAACAPTLRRLQILAPSRGTKILTTRIFLLANYLPQTPDYLSMGTGVRC